MATLASTNVTSSISPLGEEPFAFGQSGILIEHFRVAGGSSQDTVVLTPKYITKIKGVFTQANSTNNCSTSGTTNVTLTLQSSNGSAATAATLLAFDAWVIGNR